MDSRRGDDGEGKRGEEEGKKEEEEKNGEDEEEGEERRRGGGFEKGGEGRGGEEKEEREKDREGQEVPSSPSIFFPACRRVAGSPGPGGGWRVCSAELLLLLGPQACLPQGPHSWCLLPLSFPASLWVQGKKRNFRSEQGNRKCKKPQEKQVLQRPLGGPGLLLPRTGLDTLPSDWDPPPFD